MRAGPRRDRAIVSGDIAGGAVGVVSEIAGHRHREPRRDHGLAEIAAPDCDRADRATVAGRSGQPDHGIAGLERAGSNVLCRLAALPATRIATTQLATLEGVGALSRVFCDRKIRYDK